METLADGCGLNMNISSRSLLMTLVANGKSHIYLTFDIMATGIFSLFKEVLKVFFKSADLEGGSKNINTNI